MSPLPPLSIAPPHNQCNALSTKRYYPSVKSHSEMCTLLHLYFGGECWECKLKSASHHNKGLSMLHQKESQPYDVCLSVCKHNTHPTSNAFFHPEWLSATIVLHKKNTHTLFCGKRYFRIFRSKEEEMRQEKERGEEHKWKQKRGDGGGKKRRQEEWRQCAAEAYVTSYQATGRVKDTVLPVPC